MPSLDLGANSFRQNGSIKDDHALAVALTGMDQINWRRLGLRNKNALNIKAQGLISLSFFAPFCFVGILHALRSIK